MVCKEWPLNNVFYFEFFFLGSQGLSPGKPGILYLGSQENMYVTVSFFLGGQGFGPGKPGIYSDLVHIPSPNG